MGGRPALEPGRPGENSQRPQASVSGRPSLIINVPVTKGPARIPGEEGGECPVAPPLLPLPGQPQGQFSIRIFPMSFFFLPDLNDDGDGTANDSDSIII